MSNRSKEISHWKQRGNDQGHEMGNVVNCAPLPGTALTVHTRCRKCGQGYYIVYNATTNSWGAQGNIGQCSN